MTSGHSDTLSEMGLRPQLGHDLPTLFSWLEHEGLTDTGRVFDCPPGDRLPGAMALGERVALAQSTGRLAARPKKQEEIKGLKARFKNTPSGISEDALWSAVRDAASSVRTLRWDKLPAEAMAFYRPFHFPPFDQWGIYLLIGPLLDYHKNLVQQSLPLNLFSPEILMHLILFEVFNHEFFHHLVESTATTLELILATQCQSQPVYLRHRQQQAANTFGHPHAPLEEALANAYAYNALSFISRIKAGFKTASVKAYQQAVVKHWKCEPPGYREAGFYIGGDYIPGSTVLLELLLEKPTVSNRVPLSIVAKHVMPNGFTALLAKPDIPTWLVGSEAELALFNKLVPAPNEAYTQLFWPYNTDRFDQFIAKKLAEEKARKAAMKAVPPKSPRQAGLFDDLDQEP
jgi:hypothetical protein